MEQGGWRTFWVLNFLENYMIYTLDRVIYINIGIYIIFVHKIILVVFIFQQIGELPDFFQNHFGRKVFSKMVPNFTVLEGIFDAKFQG